MPDTQSTEAPSDVRSPLATYGPPALLVVLACVAFLPAALQGGDYILDDTSTFLINPNVKSLSLDALGAPDQSPLVDRPVSAYTFAVSYAIGGFDIASFRVLSVLFHVLTALLLYGVVRQLLLTPTLRDRYGAAATPLATAIAAIWVVHPLNSEAVFYVTQRTELVMGLFFLLTVYAAIRWWREENKAEASGWLGAAIMACFLGMGSKETMFVAPIAVLLIDRAWFSGSFRVALSRHRALHIGLFATWALLIVLLLTGGSRSESVGFHHDLTAWGYLRIQAGMILRYIWLAFVPYPLTPHYDASVPGVMGWLPQGLIVLAMVGATVWGIMKERAWAVLGAWFFLTLAPTSSFVPITTAVGGERRMYLPLMAIAALVVLAVWRWLVARDAEATDDRKIPFAGQAFLGVLCLVCVGLVAGTMLRVDLWRDSVALWTDAVAKRPTGVSYHALGASYRQAGQEDKAVEAFKKSIEVEPDHVRGYVALSEVARKAGQLAVAERYARQAIEVDAGEPGPHYALGVVLEMTDRRAEAVDALERSIAIKPTASAHFSLAAIHDAERRVDKAMHHYERATKLQPTAKAHDRLARLYFANGDDELAEFEFLKALQIDPQYADAYKGLGELMLTRKRMGDAIRLFSTAIELAPDDAATALRYGTILVDAGKNAAAVEYIRKAVEAEPSNSLAWATLGEALMRANQADAAVGAIEQAMATAEENPPSAALLEQYARALALAGKLNEAIAQFRFAIDADPKSPSYHDNLGVALARAKRYEEAVESFKRALKLDPKFKLAQQHLEVAKRVLAKQANPDQPAPDASDSDDATTPSAPATSTPDATPSAPPTDPK